MRSATSVFFVLLCSFVPTRAFSPLRYGSALRVASLRPSTLLPTETPTREAADDDSDRSLSRLELEEGSLRVHSPDFTATDLLNGLSSSIWSASRAKDGDDSSLFLHTSHTQKKAEHEKTLGDLMACQRLLACSRLTRYWMGPKVGTRAQDVPFDTQFLLVEVLKDEQYALVLPLVDNGFRAALHYDETHIQVVCAAESGDAAVQSKGMRALYVRVGNDPFEVIRQGFAQVADVTQTFATLENKQLPPAVNDFGWCTWDAFYSAVTPEGVLQGVEELTKAGVPPRNLILDDGWQEVTPSPPAWELDKEDEIEVSKRGVADVAFELLVNLIESFYERFVRRAPHGSTGNRIWRFLSQTVLKPQLWQFFDTKTDFNRQLSGFQANFKFENKSTKQSLKNLVSELKGTFGVKQVYCWHALHGYWRGISEELGKQVGINVRNVHPHPSEHTLQLEPQLAWDPVSLFGVGLLSTEADLKKFYQHLHTPLVEAGVDGVKVDVQSGVSAVGGGSGGGPHLARLYTEAMEESVSERFQADNGAANCINCMCHSTENLYRYKKTSVARASEDFFPDRRDTNTVHLVNVAYNSLFIGEICLPDWDMFHSKHQDAGLHAAARAVGGCPVYVSDAPGQHDVDLLRKLVLPDGSVLRAQLPGRPTRDCLFVDVTSDGTSALKVWNQNSVTGVVGAFHTQGVQWNFDTHENEIVHPSPPPLTAVVKAHDVETLRSMSGPFVAWRHRAGRMEFLKSGQTEMKARLNHREWEIFTIAPVQILDDRLMWGPIGLSNMMNSGGALLASGPLEQQGQSTVARIECRGPGRFVSFTNVAPSAVYLEDDGTTLAFKHNDGALSFDVPEESPLGSARRIIVEWN